MNLPKDLEVGTGSLPAADLARRWWCRPGGECAVRLVGLHAGGSASTPALTQGSASTPAQGDKGGDSGGGKKRKAGKGDKGGGQGGGQDDGGKKRKIGDSFFVG